MTVYLVPCGRSVHAGLKNSRYCPQGVQPARFARAEEQWWPRARQADGLGVVAAWAGALAAVADAVRLPSWDTRISAETSTLRARAQKALPELLEQGDRIALLASDTDEGMSAALTVAYIISGGNISRVRCVTAPADEDAARRFPEALAAGTVTVVRVGGLSPGSTGLRAAVAGIGRILRAAYDLDDETEVHLTGGFKITLLHTLAMTEILYSLQRAHVSAWYIFDDDTGQAIRIGLRRFPEEYLLHMREELSSVKLNRPFIGGTFEGLAWEATASGLPWLTEFGEGYLAVLGGPVSTVAIDGAR